MKKYIALSLSILLCACSAIPTNNKVGQLDTNYDFGKPEKSKNLKMAIVVPNTGITGRARFDNSLYNKSSIYEKYTKEVFDAFESNFEKLITVRGFTYSGPYNNFDEITYGDKKNSYIAIMPFFKLSVYDSNIHKNSQTSYIQETGYIHVDGTLIVKMIEPLTKQVVAQKRIDMSSLDINEPYTIQKEKKVQGDMISMALGNAMKSASAPKELTVNYDKAYAKAMTKFFQESMKQIDKFTSSAEILSYKRDIKELKANKRFL